MSSDKSIFGLYLNFKAMQKEIDEFKSQKPFDHIVIDGFLHDDMAECLLEEFPLVTGKWYSYENPFEKKRACDKIELMPETIMASLLLLNSSPFVRYLESLSGLSGLIPDPHFRGGGCHAIAPGGHLDIHEDFSIHPELKLYRRLNVLIYLNKDCKGKGGELELWNQDMTKCVEKIEPKFNRCVIFRTDQKSNHGHPSVWKGPDYRKSIATYYYTATHEQQDMILTHSTLFKKRPDEDTTPAIEAMRDLRNKGRLSE